MHEYFVLECFGPDGERRCPIREVARGPDVMWNRGRFFANPPATPVEVHLEPGHGGPLRPLMDGPVLLMREDLVGALSNAGVNNLQVFDASLVEAESGRRHLDFKAVNVLGLVAAADLKRSKYTSTGDSVLFATDFETLVIDESKARGMPFFRLAERPSAKIIHRRVKEVLERRVQGLDFIRPEDWFG